MVIVRRGRQSLDRGSQARPRPDGLEIRRAGARDSDERANPGRHGLPVQLVPPFAVSRMFAPPTAVQLVVLMQLTAERAVAPVGLPMSCRWSPVGGGDHV